ncbi:MAG: DUF1876 domain-containing protein [Pseudonocardiaceae bacterium]|nr:DUF1876 domain-containing protein [Pseudonocardiaceae bacterium]
MRDEQKWTVDIVLDKQNGTTRAQARLHAEDELSLVGIGLARRGPHDSDVPEVEAELAVARALADLIEELIEAAAADIESASVRAMRKTD